MLHITYNKHPTLPHQNPCIHHTFQHMAQTYSIHIVPSPIFHMRPPYCTCICNIIMSSTVFGVTV